MRSIRGGAGLGDAIYVAGVARHLLARGEMLEVCTNYPDIYRQLQTRIRVSPYRRKPVDIVAHYTTRRHVPGTSQFQDCCISAGLPANLDFCLPWRPINLGLVARLEAAGRPVIVVQMPRAPFGRTDGFGAEFLPDVTAIQHAIDMIAGRAFIVQIGAGTPERFDGRKLMPFDGYRGIDLDLTNKTSVSDVLDIAALADGLLGQCSFIVPLAESFAKPALLIWSRKGLCSPHEVVRQMTPQKILHRATSRAVLDDCRDVELIEAVNALCEPIRYSVAV